MLTKLDIGEKKSGKKEDIFLRSIKSNLPINIRTRGEPYEYQNIGTLTNASGTNDVKPLYGRRTYRGSNEWNYYTLLNNHIQVKQAIEIKDLALAGRFGQWKYYWTDDCVLRGKKLSD